MIESLSADEVEREFQKRLEEEKKRKDAVEEEVNYCYNNTSVLSPSQRRPRDDKGSASRSGLASTLKHSHLTDSYLLSKSLNSRHLSLLFNPNC